MRSVFEGGAGVESGGREVRSRDNGDRDRFADKEGDESVEIGGEFDDRFCVCMGEGVCRCTSAILAV